MGCSGAETLAGSFTWDFCGNINAITAVYESDVWHATQAIVLGHPDHTIIAGEFVFTGGEQEAGVVRIEITFRSKEVESEAVQLVLTQEGTLLPGCVLSDAYQVTILDFTLLTVLVARGAWVCSRCSETHQEEEADHHPLLTLHC